MQGRGERCRKKRPRHLADGIALHLAQAVHFLSRSHTILCRPSQGRMLLQASLGGHKQLGQHNHCCPELRDAPCAAGAKCKNAQGYMKSSAWETSITHAPCFLHNLLSRLFWRHGLDQLRPTP